MSIDLGFSKKLVGGYIAQKNFRINPKFQGKLGKYSVPKRSRCEDRRVLHQMVQLVGQGLNINYFINTGVQR